MEIQWTVTLGKRFSFFFLCLSGRREVNCNPPRVPGQMIYVSRFVQLSALRLSSVRFPAMNRSFLTFALLFPRLLLHFAKSGRFTGCRVVGPMMILPGSLSSLSDVGKKGATYFWPVGPSQRRSAGPFPVVVGHLGPTSDCLLVKKKKLLAELLLFAKYF